MTPKEIKAAESLLRSWQGRVDARDKLEYHVGKINGLIEFLEDCECVVLQDGNGLYAVRWI